MTNKTERFTVWHGLFLAEGTAVLIGLIMPITPSKTGSNRGLAHFIFPEPSYWQQVCVYFVITNLLLIILGMAIAVWCKLGDSR
jgi:uncharacterized membrane protein